MDDTTISVSKPTTREFLRVLIADWASLVSGGLSVPFTYIGPGRREPVHKGPLRGTRRYRNHFRQLSTSGEGAPITSTNDRKGSPAESAGSSATVQGRKNIGEKANPTPSRLWFDCENVSSHDTPLGETRLA
jgi:hypothetical protein